VCVCVCGCVCEIEREGERLRGCKRERERERASRVFFFFSPLSSVSFFLSLFPNRKLFFSSVAVQRFDRKVNVIFNVVLTSFLASFNRIFFFKIRLLFYNEGSKYRFRIFVAKKGCQSVVLMFRVQKETMKRTPVSPPPSK